MEKLDVKEIKQKPKIKIYVEQVDQEGKKILKEIVALWENKSKDNKIYYTGKIGNVRVVGFENE